MGLDIGMEKGHQWKNWRSKNKVFRVLHQRRFLSFDKVTMVKKNADIRGSWLNCI